MKPVSRQCWQWLFLSLSVAQAIKFDVREQECWMHETESDKEVVQMFVEVDKDVSPGPSRHMGVDVVIQAPRGQYIHIEKVKLEAIRDDVNSVSTQYKATINFTAIEKGQYKICFHNRGNMIETIKLDIYHTNIDHEEHVKDVHIRSLMNQIASLADALVDVEFEQDWLASHIDKHTSILSDLSKRVVYRAMFEAFAFITCSALQVVILQQFFHKHLLGKIH